MHPTRLFIACLIVWSSALPVQALGQRIFGSVRDAETNAPLPGAHVFIAGSLLGTAADRSGRFAIERVPPGSHRIVGSMIGFDRSTVDTTLHDTDLEINFRLEPRVTVAGEVEIIAHADPKWAKRLVTFQSEFLGETEGSDECTILNPEVLEFEARWWGRLVATASAPLVVENRWLGYRIDYHLTEFRHSPSLLRYDGDPVFEELEPTSDEERSKWARNRVKAFNGSLRHFLLALLADSTAQHGFHIFRRPSLSNPAQSAMRFPVNPSRLLGSSDSIGVTVRFGGYVEIIYDKEMEDPAIMRSQGTYNSRRPAPQRSWITLSDGPTKIDRLGSVVDPYGITLSGYLAFERVADELPKEYRPPGVFLIPGT